MSSLNPAGAAVMVDGVERHLLFTLNAIEEIQERYGLPLSEVMEKFGDPMELPKVMRCIVAVLLADEAERTGGDLKVYTEKEIGWKILEGDQIPWLTAILKAYGGSLPEAEEEDDAPNRKSGSMKD